AVATRSKSMVTWRRRLRWIVLAAIPSTWMLAVTSYFTTVIRPMPLLWIIPLVLYLFSFAVVFARRPPIPLRWLNRLFPFYALPVLGMVLLGGSGPFIALAVLHFGAFFLAALLCHGELAADRPAAADLTEFYWWVAVGGAAGGLMCAVIAPVVFNDFLEYPIAIIAAALLRPALAARNGRRSLIADFALPAAVAAGLLVFVGVAGASGVTARLDRVTVTNAASGSDLLRVLVVFAIPAVVSAAFSWRPVRFGLTLTTMLLMSLLPLGSQNVLFQQRDFFGVHKVVSDRAGFRHDLIDGGVIHGIQLTNPALRDIPSSYYSASGPVGDFFASQSAVDSAWSVGVIGLGAGSIGCYAQPGQSWTYFEIDQTVIDIARNPSLFTFMRDCTPNAKVTVGDARLTIARVPDRSYNLIVVDAFGGDAIPVHLLTREAIELYLAKLRPGGVLLFNISNKYVDIGSVLAGQASALDLVSYVRTDTNVTSEQAAMGKFESAWLVMAREPADLAGLPSTPGWVQQSATAQSPVWTDDFSDLLTVMRIG
ncbi:MAG TPA: fused MFS/spermidine synthase, partial [Candidatus Dormibacteraeota bacterium]|nr:fused MFS/spermidine synthase [Candidatus Dormibacteraeota bacterium]